MTNNNSNQLDSINFTSLHHQSLGATRRTKAAAIFQQNKQRQRPSHVRASALLANKKHKGETELRTNTGHQSTQHHGNSLQTSPPNLPPIAFRSLTINSNYSTTPRFHGLASVE
jgi:hypothetical protein